MSSGLRNDSNWLINNVLIVLVSMPSTESILIVNIREKKIAHEGVHLHVCSIAKLFPFKHNTCSINICPHGQGAA